MKTFYNLLANTLLVTFANNYIWFALIFWLYLNTQSVIATSMLSGIFLVLTSISGFYFGYLVDIYDKKFILQIGNYISVLLYGVGAVMFSTGAVGDVTNAANPILWIAIIILMTGVTFGNLYNIVVPTMVTTLVPQQNHDRANGLYGTTSGIAFALTSVASGASIGFGSISLTLVFAIIGLVIAQIYLRLIKFPSVEKDGTKEAKEKFSLIKTFKIIQSTPGLLGLIIFTTFNNFLLGVFMSLMDAYGLILVDVKVWGIIWGVLSTVGILGSLYIARRGLGKNPIRTLFIVYPIMWIDCILFVIQPSIVLLILGAIVWMVLFPFVEAIEQTIIQRVVPPEKQGKVFGFAQSIEQSASPITAFLIGPIASATFIPFMTTGAGVDLIGDWFGTGVDRGIALVFISAGIIGLITTSYAVRTKSFKILSAIFES